jgi:hypothetical protein
MNSAISNFRMIIRQVDLPRSKATLKIAACGDGLAPIDRLARRPQTEENHRVEHVGELR